MMRGIRLLLCVKGLTTNFRSACFHFSTTTTIATSAYDPSNPYYRKASEFFWDRYKQELDSWRDQPLWAYTLHHFGIEPLTMRHDTLHSFILEDFDLKGDHHYDEHSVTHAKKEV